VNEEPIYVFNDFIQFSATIQSSDPISEVWIFLSPVGKSDGGQVFPMALDRQGKATFRYDLKLQPLRAFSSIEYHYQLTYESGGKDDSSSYNFRYLDNRYGWKSLDSVPFRVHWYAGDLTFAQEVLNVAHAGQKRLTEILEVYLPNELDIYVYSSATEMQTALPASSAPIWIAGHADPDLGVILVSLPPGPEQQLEIERQIPHELMHIALYHTDAPTYENLPIWFNEGLASLAELYPGPEYQTILDNAFQAGGMLSMASLCRAFPNDSAQRLLAYAQSASFTRYLFEQYGTGGLNRLRAGYATKLGCRPGMEKALQTSLEGLEGRWLRDTFAEGAWQKVKSDLLPWLIVLAVILIGPLIMVFGVLRKRPARLNSTARRP
jgi:hypothetical protein